MFWVTRAGVDRGRHGAPMFAQCPRGGCESASSRWNGTTPTRPSTASTSATRLSRHRERKSNARCATAINWGVTRHLRSFRRDACRVRSHRKMGVVDLDDIDADPLVERDLAGQRPTQSRTTSSSRWSERSSRGSAVRDSPACTSSIICWRSSADARVLGIGLDKPHYLRHCMHGRNRGCEHVIGQQRAFLDPATFCSASLLNTPTDALAAA